jgi:hypothetical protein
MAPSVVEVHENGNASTNTTGLHKLSLLNGHKQNVVVDHHEVQQTHAQMPSGRYGDCKKMRIAVIGAGASGLNFFNAAEEKLRNVEITCLEKNEDIGGTSVSTRFFCCKSHADCCTDGLKTDIQAALATFLASRISFHGADDLGQSIVSSSSIQSLSTNHVMFLYVSQGRLTLC